MMKKILTLLFICVTVLSYASDSLKVKRVRFFIEPKASFIIPIHKHYSGSFNSAGVDWDPISPPPENYTYTWNNKTSSNPSVSAGFSVKLSKHVFYEFSIAYSHYFFRRSINVFDSITMTPSTSKQNISYNLLSISNGISLKYGRIIISNSAHIGTYFTDKIDLENNLCLMSEHKIGYSFLKDRLDAYVGVNIIFYSGFGSYFDEKQKLYSYYQDTLNPFATPFTSLRINF